MLRNGGVIEKKYILWILLFGGCLFSQEYCAGDVIIPAHQNSTFNVCYPCDTCDSWSLSQYDGDIIFIDLSASWCSSCYNSIELIEELEAYWDIHNQNVKFFTSLADIGYPYSCQQWGLHGDSNSPIIIEDNGDLTNWFQDSNGGYPNYVIIDHEMRVRAKLSNILENYNTDACDGSSEDIYDWDGGCLNDFIFQLLDECGEDCNYSVGCDDASACNYGSSGSCIYASDNYDCCGECIVEVDCFGVCGGDAESSECEQTMAGCPTCTIVCHPDDENCIGDFTSIQDAISSNSVQDGDTILVEPGTYYENLIIQKDITLGSRAILQQVNGQLEGWYDYLDENYITNEYISGTVLNGSADTNGEGYESVLLIEGDCIEPEIFGFTITGGNGTLVEIEVEGSDGGRERVQEIKGGGFLAKDALPKFKYNAIIDNKGKTNSEGHIIDPIKSGGGGDQTSGVDVPTHPDFNWGNHLRSVMEI